MLGDNQRTNRYVANVPGRGYVFVAPATSEEPVRRSAEPADKREATHELPPPLARMVGRDDVVSALTGLGIEAILTAMLVLVIVATAKEARVVGAEAALAVGGVIAACAAELIFAASSHCLR